ncbi:MAG: YdeI/OmpD-associated family protein [Pyrinomonadaceae bacterium]
MSKEDDSDLLKFLDPFPVESREIALALRDWVWDLYPECNELIYDNYNFLAFGWSPTDRAGDVFCSIPVGMRGVAFGLMWGAKLDDPDGLLTGSGKQFRSFRVPEISTFPKVYAKKLLKQAFEISIDGLSGRPQKPNGQTITKSISPTKRRPGMPKKSAAAKRERHPMPDDVLNALESSNLFEAYESRPPYQQNDYIGWITDAKRPETKAARLEQMLDELRSGDRYMKMPYNPSSRSR